MSKTHWIVENSKKLTYKDYYIYDNEEDKKPSKLDRLIFFRHLESNICIMPLGEHSYVFSLDRKNKKATVIGNLPEGIYIECFTLSGWSNPKILNEKYSNIDDLIVPTKLGML